MDGPEIYERLALALAVGLLIGVERGWQQRAGPEGSRVAGIRTFGIVGLLGGVAALVSGSLATAAFGLAFLGFAAVLVGAHAIAASRTGDLSATSAMAGLLTFLLGATAVQGEMAVAAAGAVVATLLLSVKPVLHHWLERLEYRELSATLKLLLISVVALPVLPDRGFGPWEALNPYEIWWMVVLIAGISFCGYVAVRLAGPRRGLLLTGLFGGLASSTAVAVNFARLSRTSPGAEALLAAGIVAASATMFLRVLLVLAIVQPALLGLLGWPLAAAAVVSYAGVAWLARRGGQSAPALQVQIENPFEFWIALRFGVLLAVIMVLAHALPQWLGRPGLALLAAVSGLADVDAITLSMARLAGDGVTAAAAAMAIGIAAAVNTAVKAGLAAAIGRPALGVRVVLVLAAALVTAVVLWGAMGGTAGAPDLDAPAPAIDEP
jgi:uncharacterized membrane protein (DUF4010 family)